MRLARLGALILGLLAAPALAVSQTIPAPDRQPGEGEGPFERLIIRGAILIDGTGAPPTGPVDIVIEGNRITEVRNVGFPGLAIDSSRRPRNATREIDAHGQYVMPGLIDLHVHAGGGSKNPELSYAYKLWLAHGITTVRGVGLTGFEVAKSEQGRSASNAIVAPRIVNYQGPGSGWDRGPIRTPELGRDWVRWAAEQGIDGIKLGTNDITDPAVVAAVLDEAKRQKLGSTAHLGQLGVGRMNALDAARLGLGAMTHFYGLFEALYKDLSIQPWPTDFNYQNEQHRFGQVARQWNMIHEPGSDRWNALIREFLDLKFILDPTMTIYHAGTNVMAARNADWHDTYTLPSMWDFYTPSREAHGSYWFDWTTEDEVAWGRFYQRWMQFLNDYKNAGGRVTTGSDAGFIYKLYGFGLIEELELLQHAGFHPLEVVRAATLHGAEAIHEPKGVPIEYGIVRPGMLADLVILPENPLQNFKTLYGTGHVRLNEDTGRPERVGGVRYTIKDGIVYDAKRLLADVAEMVRAQKVARGMAADARLKRY
jgi:hypothetical protein